MFIKSITLNNFRVYKGVNRVSFERDEQRNVHIISGFNGYGKTTVLTSLIWCLYGGQMQDVDEELKRRIKEAGGYIKYLESGINRAAANELETLYDVSIVFSELEIPGITAKEVSVKRSYTLGERIDKLEIFIDGHRNELVDEVGYEIFIQDFILPKEIAKFFFFDAEKITSLAESQTLEQKRQLGKAYSEVLGIKKYVDLRGNLIDLRLKYRKESASAKDIEKNTALETQVNELEQQKLAIEKDKLWCEEKTKSNQEQITIIQNDLWRGGNTYNLEELDKFRKKRDQLNTEAKELKEKLNTLLDLAPFAIAGKLFFNMAAKASREFEQNQKGGLKANDLQAIYQEIDLTLGGLSTIVEKQALEDTFSPILSKLKGLIDKAENSLSVPQFDFNDTDFKELKAIEAQLRFSYREQFNLLSRALKKNRYEINEVNKKLNQAESKATDLNVQRLQLQLDNLQKANKELEEQRDICVGKLGVLQNDLNNKKKVLAEFQKRIDVKHDLVEKDLIAKRLIGELNEFIEKIQQEKKYLLEAAITQGLNNLMHKKHFVKSVNISIEGEIIDIDLIGENDNLINKEDLSMGEKQLYATAIFHALVKESKIEFPVFIDSPMQKLDIEHATNILKEFYPKVSKQVIILPLISKEITAAEYRLLEGHVISCHLIRHNPENESSKLLEIKPSELYDYMEGTDKRRVHV